VKTRNWLSASVLAFSLASAPACQDRFFDNPFDPNASDVIFEVIAAIQTPAYIPLGLTWDGTTLWNLDGYNNVLYGLNRANGTIVRSLSAPLPGAAGVAYDGRFLWNVDEILRINVLNGEVLKRLYLQRGQFTALGYGPDVLWVADAQSNAILRVHPETAEILGSFPNPGVRADGIVFDGTALWISDSTTLTIVQVTTDGRLLRKFLSPGQSPRGLAYDGRFLWNVDGNQRIYQLRFSQ
jgi:DNA-binding beta-propeller fold protein YncE